MALYSCTYRWRRGHERKATCPTIWVARYQPRPRTGHATPSVRERRAPQAVHHSPGTHLADIGRVDAGKVPHDHSAVVRGGDQALVVEPNCGDGRAGALDGRDHAMVMAVPDWIGGPGRTAGVERSQCGVGRCERSGRCDPARVTHGLLRPYPRYCVGRHRFRRQYARGGTGSPGCGCCD